jgi:hypothetical protein
LTLIIPLPIVEAIVVPNIRKAIKLKKAAQMTEKTWEKRPTNSTYYQRSSWFK